MPKPRLPEVQNFPDPLQSDFYELILPGIPGGGDTNSLRIQCQQVSLPSKLIEPINLDIAGNQLMFAGRSLFTHDFNVTFVENRMMSVHKALTNWIEFVRAHDPQTGNFKAVYSRTAFLTAFDQMGGIANKWTLFGLWPSTLPELPFDGAASNIITLQCTFQIDYWEMS